MDKIKQKCQMLRADMKLKVHDDNYKKKHRTINIYFTTPGSCQYLWTHVELIASHIRVYI